MTDTAVLIACVVVSGLAGLLGYILGHREGTLEGFLNGAVTILTENDDFLAYNSHLVKHMQQKAEGEDDDDDDDYHNDYYECQ